MAELKTQKTGSSVSEFLDAIPDEGQRKDSKTLSKMMGRITGAKPKMWGPSIVGFGEFHYRSKAGTEGDWFKVGFSPRKQNLTLYLSLSDVASEYNAFARSAGQAQHRQVMPLHQAAGGRGPAGPGGDDREGGCLLSRVASGRPASAAGRR